MTNKPLYLSDLISDLQRKLNSVLVDEGCIRLDRARSATLVTNMGKLADHARNLESHLSLTELNRRSFADREQLIANMTATTAKVLELLRDDRHDDDKIVQFRPKPRQAHGPSVPPGGDAA